MLLEELKERKIYDVYFERYNDHRKILPLSFVDGIATMFLMKSQKNNAIVLWCRCESDPNRLKHPYYGINFATSVYLQTIISRKCTAEFGYLFENNKYDVFEMERIETYDLNGYMISPHILQNMSFFSLTVDEVLDTIDPVLWEEFCDGIVCV